MKASACCGPKEWRLGNQGNALFFRLSFLKKASQQFCVSAWAPALEKGRKGTKPPGGLGESASIQVFAHNHEEWSRRYNIRTNQFRWISLQKFVHQFCDLLLGRQCFLPRSGRHKRCRGRTNAGTLRLAEMTQSAERRSLSCKQSGLLLQLCRHQRNRSNSSSGVVSGTGTLWLMATERTM